MKTKTIKTLGRIFLLGMYTIMITLPLTLSAKKIPFLNSTVTPAATGYVKIKKDKNKNYMIKIHISNLAEIERIVPTKQTYVVWMVTDRELTKNIGRINSSKNISNNLTGNFESVTSFQPTQIFITAELDESVQVPGDQVVLTTDRFWE